MNILPRLATIRQPVPTAPLNDVARTVRAELARLNLSAQIMPGARIAVVAGSRGITDYALVIKTVIEELHALGAAPFIFPAMGSHGGATADGQRQVLAEHGVTAAAMGCPVHSALDVVEIGRTTTGMPVFCDARAYASDGIIIVNRVKPHTDFHGPTESGLTKMIAIGLGKRHGAELLHQRGVRGLREDIPRVAAVQLANAPIIGGLAIVEDGAHHVSWVQAVRAADIPQVEPQLLERARQLMATLPVAACDVLIIDQIGKDMSGVGMDPNIIGRLYIDGEPEPATPQIGQIVALRLTPASHGNATGIGFADVTTQQLIDAMDAEITRINIVTSGFPLRGRIPTIMPDDRAAIIHALRLAQPTASANPTVVRIQNTLSLATLQISEQLLHDVLSRSGVELLAPPHDLRFSAAGALL